MRSRSTASRASFATVSCLLICSWLAIVVAQLPPLPYKLGTVDPASVASGNTLSPWAATTLSFERYLAGDVPLNLAGFPRTHNSYNYLDNTSPLFETRRNQQYTITDQLNLGIRGIEIDSNYVPQLLQPSDPATDALVVFHLDDVTGSVLYFFCEYLWPILLQPGFPLSALGLPDGYDICLDAFNTPYTGLYSKTGVKANAPKLQDELQQIQQFLAANPNEVVTLYLDDAYQALDTTAGWTTPITIPELFGDTPVAFPGYDQASTIAILSEAFGNQDFSALLGLQPVLTTQQPRAVQLTDQVLKSLFGSSIFTPANKAHWSRTNGNGWPSKNQLLAMGKQLMVYFSHTTTSTEGFPYGAVLPSNDYEIGVYQFATYPACGSYADGVNIEKLNENFTLVKGDNADNVLNLTIGGQTVIPFLINNDNRVVPGYPTGDSYNFVNYSDTANILACGYSPTYDMMDNRMALSNIWSFAPGYPQAVTTIFGLVSYWPNVCVASGPSGWTNVPCTLNLPLACVKSSSDGRNSSDWLITAKGASRCPPGYQYSVPLLPQHQWALNVVKNTSNQPSVYLNYRLDTNCFFTCYECSQSVQTGPNNQAAAIGGGVGGCAAAIAIVAVVIRRRRRRNAQDKQDPQAAGVSESNSVCITPAVSTTVEVSTTELASLAQVQQAYEMLQTVSSNSPASTSAPL